MNNNHKVLKIIFSMLALFVISRFFARYSGRWAAIIGKQFSDEFGATFGDKLQYFLNIRPFASIKIWPNSIKNYQSV